MSEASLTFRSVRAAYGEIEALSGIDLEIPRGGIFAILGPNGAGKSTLLRVAAGLHPPSAGQVEFDGRLVNGVRGDKLARQGLCLIPEGRGVFPSLTVRENLRVMTHTGLSMATIEDRVYDQFPQLAQRRFQHAGTLSGGEQQMLALGRAVATDPKLLLVDELSMGLAPKIVSALYELIAELAKGGLTVLVVEQFAHTVLGVANRAAILTSGTISMVGSPKELEGELAATYLGDR